MTGGMQDVFQEQVPNIQMSVEKVEKIVEVHQLQFSVSGGGCAVESQ